MAKGLKHNFWPISGLDRPRRPLGSQPKRHKQRKISEEGHQSLHPAREIDFTDLAQLNKQLTKKLRRKSSPQVGGQYPELLQYTI